MAKVEANTSSPNEPLAAKQVNLAGTGTETDLDQAHQLMQVPRMPTDQLIEVLESMLANRPITTDQLMPTDQPTPADIPMPTDEPMPTDQLMPTDQPTPADIPMPTDEPIQLDMYAM